MKEVYEFVDKNSNLFLEEFREFIRKPGISTENTGIKETVSWLVEKMKENGIENVQVSETQRHPIVLGRVAGKGAKRTLLVYGHYDVQPPGDSHDWKADPFAAEVVGDSIIGRGTCDMKNNVMASIHAVKALLQCKKKLPINLIFLFEGEEEIGSPNLRLFIEEHKDELSVCDAILCGEGGENKAGVVNLFYGWKGMLYVELSVKSPTGVEFHSSLAGITDSPAWRLIHALRSLKEDEKALIPHFYDGVKEPTDEEKSRYGLVDVAIPKEIFEEVYELKVKKEMSMSEAVLEMFYRPTLNIDGFCSGYTERGKIKSIVPDSAWAKLDMRLVPGQDPTIIFENMKKHLESRGFTDVGIENLGLNLPAYRVDPNETIVQVVNHAVKQVVSDQTLEAPIAPGSGAMVWLPVILGKPMASGGSGALYMGHRPNEFITKEQYLKGIKFFATIYNDYAS